VRVPGLDAAPQLEDVTGAWPAVKVPCGGSIVHEKAGAVSHCQGGPVLGVACAGQQTCHLIDAEDLGLLLRLTHPAHALAQRADGRFTMGHGSVSCVVGYGVATTTSTQGRSSTPLAEFDPLVI
jgi:hypothetical protein